MKEELFNYIRDNNIEKVKELIDYSIDINTKNSIGDTALLHASWYGKKEIVELLLKQPNININSQNNDGNTALLDASYCGYYEIVELLLKHPDINVELKNNDDRNFIDKLSDNSFLINYQLQKEILNNDREDIILFFNQYDLIYPDIKKEYKDLFQASNWGLI